MKASERIAVEADSRIRVWSDSEYDFDEALPTKATYPILNDRRKVKQKVLQRADDISWCYKKGGVGSNDWTFHLERKLEGV